MAFILDWQEKLGYRADPFVGLPPAELRGFFVGREAECERLNLFVVKHRRIGVLRGEKGAGKTTLLAWLKAELAHHDAKIAVLSVDDAKLLADKDAFAQALLEPHLSILERVTKPHIKAKPAEREAMAAEKMGKKRVLLLVDNADGLADENLQLLVRLVEKCPGLQVLLAAEKAPGAVDETIEIAAMPRNELAELLSKRIALVSKHAPHPFSDDDLEALAEESKGSIAKLLSLARDRAIELSVKPLEAHKIPAKKEAKRREPEQREPESREPEDVGEAPRKKWFTLEIVKTKDKVLFGDEDDEDDEEEKPEARAPPPRSKAAAEKAEEPEGEIDFALIEQALGGATSTKRSETPSKKSDSGIIKGGRRR